MTSLVLRLIDRCACKELVSRGHPAGSRSRRGRSRSAGNLPDARDRRHPREPRWHRAGWDFNHRFSALYHAGPERVNGLSPTRFPTARPSWTPVPRSEEDATGREATRREATLLLTSEMTASV